VSVERRPVHDLVALSACPCGVPATMTKAGLMPHEHLAGAEGVPVRAALGWANHPLAIRAAHQIPDSRHGSKGSVVTAVAAIGGAGF
jgi:hypothetical protein